MSQSQQAFCQLFTPLVNNRLSLAFVIMPNLLKSFERIACRNPATSGRVKASYLTSEKRLTAASVPYAAEKSSPFKEEILQFTYIRSFILIYPIDN